jgi:hypothetical protein
MSQLPPGMTRDGRRYPALSPTFFNHKSRFLPSTAYPETILAERQSRSRIRGSVHEVLEPRIRGVEAIARGDAFLNATRLGASSFRRPGTSLVLAAKLC